eukprot:RCo020463
MSVSSSAWAESMGASFVLQMDHPIPGLCSGAAPQKALFAQGEQQRGGAVTGVGLEDGLEPLLGLIETPFGKLVEPLSEQLGNFNQHWPWDVLPSVHYCVFF